MEQTEKVEGVHKANGTNGKRSGGCILYQTRALLQARASIRKSRSGLLLCLFFDVGICSGLFFIPFCMSQQAMLDQNVHFAVASFQLQIAGV